MFIIKNVLVGGKVANVHLIGNRVSKISYDKSEDTSNTPSFDGKGGVLMPAFIDMHVHLREPGYEYKEDIKSGLESAVAGGYSAVCPMPNTNPVTDNQYIVNYIMNKARECKLARVYPIGCISKGMKGLELAEMASMQKEGIVAVSDDGMPVASSGLMRLAMEYADGLGLLVISHSEDKELAKGYVNEGANATRAGIEGINRVAEESMIAREILLADALKTKVHIAHVSTANGVDLIRWAKAKGIRVSAETGPNYICGTDELILDYNPSAKVNPPLREESDRLAIIQGLVDGTIDCIATDHAPHSMSEKSKEFATAPFGISGLESAFSMCYTELVLTGRMTLDRLSELMTTNVAKILNIPCGEIVEDGLADFVIVDESAEYTIDSSNWYSKGKNTPFNGRHVTGKVIATVVDGRLVYKI